MTENIFILLLHLIKKLARLEFSVGYNFLQNFRQKFIMKISEHMKKQSSGKYHVLIKKLTASAVVIMLPTCSIHLSTYFFVCFAGVF